ncbi:MAG: acyltransferase family protein, partial [Geminicoccaceae bacterium]
MKHQEKKFRPEIQGLRAVGALLVAAYHIWFGKVSGGVDVFFVVSGFLVLGPLAERSLDGGRIDLWRYLVGLAKRIVPTAFVVLAAVVVLALVFIPETRWQPLSKQAWASAWFFQNFQLAADSVDYLARDELPSLVQHYWAISTQVHFYLIMGAVVFATGMAARWLRIKTGSILLPALIAIFAGSLAYSIYLTGVNQTVAYFSTSTRLWEFCLGGLLYLALPRIDLGTGARLAAGWVGLVAIVACGAVLPVSSTFPGYTALWPTLAACLVIAAGGGFSRFGADRILTTAPLLNLGAISYGFYLWHWPLLIIYRVVFDVTDVSLVGGLGIMIAAAALATGTYHLVEEPIRRSKIGSQRVLPTFVLGSAFVVPVCALVAGWSLYMKHVRAEERARPLDPAVYQGALAFDAESQDRSSADVPVRPGKLLARFDRGDLEKNGCHQTLAGTEVIRCVFGNAEASRTIAVVGGSHSGHWLPTLRAMNLETPVRIVTYTKSSCVLSSEHFGN